MKEKVLILGCSGEIGSRLTIKLLDLGYRVYGVSGSKICKIRNSNHICQKINLLDSKVFLNMKEFKPNLMIHCAWVTTPQIFWESPKNLDWVLASQNIISEFMESGGKYLAVMSTCAEYAWDVMKPLNEHSDLKPSSLYGESKLKLFHWLQAQNLSFLWTRTFFQFGLTEPGGKLIPSIIDAILNKREFNVSSGNDIRDFVYILDVVKIIATLVHDKQIGIFNIGTGYGYKVNMVAKLIQQKMDDRNCVIFSQTNSKNSFVVSNSDLLNSVLGNFNWTSMDESLTETIKARSNLFRN